MGEYSYTYDPNNRPTIASITITGDTWCQTTNVTLRLDMPEPTVFLKLKFPVVSIIRPTANVTTLITQSRDASCNSAGAGVSPLNSEEINREIRWRPRRP